MTAYTRRKMSRVAIALSAIALTSTHVASAQQVSPPERFQKIIDLSIPVDEAINAQKSGHAVIVVFDIDNTLLTMPQDLGGDPWFNWKKSETSTDAKNQEPLGVFFAENSLLLQAGSMKPTQENAAALIRELQDNGVAIYALSASPSHSWWRRSGFRLVGVLSRRVCPPRVFRHALGADFPPTGLMLVAAAFGA